MHRSRAAGLIVAAYLVLAPATSAVRPSSGDAAADFLAARYGRIGQDYRVVSRTTFRGASGTYRATKLEVPGSGDIRLVYVTGSTALDPAELERREQQALVGRSAFDRKADDEVRAWVADHPGRPIPAAIWIDVDTAPAIASVAAAHPAARAAGELLVARQPEEARAVAVDLQLAKRRLFRSAEGRLAVAARAGGATIGYGSSGAPIQFLEASRTTLEELARRPEVVAIHLNAGGWLPSLASATATIGANWYTGDDRDEGTGVRVAIVEYCNADNRGDLAGAIVASRSIGSDAAGNPIEFPPINCTDSLDHATWVAGAIASHNPRERGVAPGAKIVSVAARTPNGCGYTSGCLLRDDRVILAADWAIDPSRGNAAVVSVSLDQDTTSGHLAARAYFDSISFEHGILVVASAGNYRTGVYGSAHPWYVGSPGVGWNVLTVGGIDNRGTSRRSDDRLWYSPSARPPQGAKFQEDPAALYNADGDFEKPEVSAPAVGIVSANGTGPASGTSIATPMAAAVAAQLLHRMPSLAQRPEVLKAMIMAGAVYHTPLRPGGPLSRDHEGVGTLNAHWANRTTALGGSATGGYDMGTLTAANPFQRTFPVVAGQRVRIALTWLSHTSGASLESSDALVSDLDLLVAYPGGQRTSSSRDNGWEFVEFTAAANGTVNVTVSVTTFGGLERWALAWTKGF